jgi:predicted unusual protein kinase regulating ubiquinone biosynthesis (AarF/ABC1/UbiB family)
VGENENMSIDPNHGLRLYRLWLEASRSWSDVTRRSQKVLTRTVQRSVEETRAVLDATYAAGEAPYLAGHGRLADLSRAQWFLWTGAGLTAAEVSGRAFPGTFPDACSPRTLVLGTVTADLYLGYVALRERSRLFSGLVTDQDRELQHRRGAARVLDAAEALGGVLIKAGQFASTRPDLLPSAYTETLTSLQDRVPPYPPATIREVVTRELGHPTGDIFSSFDPEPVAAASIAQVHRARLRDGTEVAVKVQYAGISGLIEADLDALETIFDAVARLEPDVRLRPISDYLRWTLPLELDFIREAEAIGALREALADREDVIVPGVIKGLTTERLLVMEFVDGLKVTDVEGLKRTGVKPREVAVLLNDVYAEQLFARGVLHADPHPGNLLVRSEGGRPRLVLLDHGLTLGLDAGIVSALGRLVHALENGDLAEISASLGETGLPVGEDTDFESLLAVVGVMLGGERRESDSAPGGFGLGLGASVGDIPPKLLLIGRAIGLLDGITRQLDPDLDALEIVGRHLRAP